MFRKQPTAITAANEEAYQRWLAANPDGRVVNHGSRRGATVHFTCCKSISFTPIKKKRGPLRCWTAGALNDQERRKLNTCRQCTGKGSPTRKGRRRRSR